MRPLLTGTCRICFVAAGCVVLVGFFVLVRWALEQPLERNPKSSAGPSEYEIASGMRVRYRHLPAESLSFKSCWRRSARIGAFVLGCFDILELDELCLNLPLPAEIGDVQPSAEKPVDAAQTIPVPAPRRGTLDNVFTNIGLPDVGNFCSVNVRGLRVGRMTDTGAELLFTAKSAKTKWTTLYLTGCEVFRDGKRESVPEAQLEWKNGLRLVWSGGSLDLPDVLEAKR